MKVIIKYGLYVFIAGWMFTLGVMVGRGNSPLTFETESFQQRLSDITREFGRQESSQAPVNLEFYEVLDGPVRHTVAGQGEILAKPAALPPRPGAKEKVPVKTGKKQETLNRKALTAMRSQASDARKKPGATKWNEALKKGVKITPAASSPETVKANADAGRYTIQVAAYKEIKDAVTHVAALKEKGFGAYYIKAGTGGGVWYRVRSGAFRDRPLAAKTLKKMKQAKIDGMIIKKEEQ